MTDKQFKNAIKEAKDLTEKQGNNNFYFFTGVFRAIMNIKKLTLNAEQFDIFINAFIREEIPENEITSILNKTN